MPLLGQFDINFTGLTTTAGSTTMWTCTSGNWQVASTSAVFSTAGGSGAAITVNVDTGTNAPGAGTAQLSSTMALNGTANTVVNGTLIGSPTTIVPGNRVSFTTSGTLTGLAGGMVTVTLKAV